MHLNYLLPALSVLTCFGSCTSPTPTPGPGQNLLIAYNVLEDEEADNYEIYVMQPDGSGQRNISQWKGVDWVYHAMGDRLYLLSDRDTAHRHLFLWEMDAAGGQQRKIYPHRLYDSWIASRKNGEEFLVTTKKDTVKTFVLIDRNGQEIRQVFGTNEYKINDPAFSPDGRWIVYRSARSGVDELWIMDEYGEQQRQLTHYPPGDTTGGKHFYHAGPPTWLAGGQWISYISKQNANYSIFRIQPDGSGLQQISPDGFNEGWHAWTPDGQWIAYDGTDLSDANFDIYTMRADGSEVKRLTDHPRYEQAPVWVLAPRPE